MIEIRIDNAFFEREQSAVMRGGRLLKELKDAGAPVKGILSIEGAERGRIVISNDEMFDQTVVQWFDEGEQ